MKISATALRGWNQIPVPSAVLVIIFSSSCSNNKSPHEFSFYPQHHLNKVLLTKGSSGCLNESTFHFYYLIIIILFSHFIHITVSVIPLLYVLIYFEVK